MIKTFNYIACCLVGVFALLPMQAQNIIQPKISGPGNLWVNSYNGVLFFEQIDFKTQNSAMPMQLSFYYNSSANPPDYGYGLGFSLGYEMRYREDVIGGVDIETGDGRTDHFTKYGDEYKAPSGMFSTLVRPTFDTYLLTTKDGMKYFFDNAHHRKVTAIEDRNGNRTSFKYQDTLLIEVKDAVGHTITLSYTDGLMTEASATFSPGKYKYEYDGLRRLRKRIDPMGNVTLYDYSRQNKIDEITDANGNKILIAYNDAGMVSRMKTDVSDKSIRYDGDKTVFIDYTEPNNVYSYYRWDNKGRAIEKVGLCCGIQSTLKYDDNNNVAQRIDANGNVTYYTHDELGNILTLKDPLGFSEQFTYEPNYNQIASYLDKNGSSYSFTYDSKGNMLSFNGPLGYNYKYSYNENGWLTMITDSKGGVTRTTYNTDGTTAKVVYPDGGSYSYQYDSFGRLVTTSDPNGYTTSYTYDDLGHVTSQKNALGNTTSVSYDKIGNIVRVLDALGNITAYSYDALGNITSHTDAMGNVTNYEYDGRGNVIAMVNSLGIRQQASYNDRNLIDSYTNEVGESINFDYDMNGNLIAVILPNGNLISYDYDEMNHLIEINDNIGLVASFEYDGNGNRTSYSDGMMRKTSFFYDALNRLVSESLPSGYKTSYAYDENSNLTSKTDALGHITSYTYDAMNRQTSHTNALNAKTQFVYDANGNITRITDAKGNATTYTFDALNHITAITYANGRSVQYTYDAIGRVTRLKDRAGNEFRYEYSPIGNLLKRIYPDGSTDSYTYNEISKLQSAINKNANIQFSYDNSGRLIRETLNDKSTTYNYDVSAGQFSITYPSGMKIIERFNNRYLISNILQNGREEVAFTYNSAGQIINQSYANGISTDYSYNENGWLSNIKDNKDAIKLQMYYDAVGNIIKREDLINSSNTEIYEYDNISQLVSLSSGNINSTWEYDLLGNRIRTTANNLTSTYQVDNINAYTSIRGGINFSPQYDNNGNMISDDSHHYQYDYNNRIIAVSDNNTVYKYDALGRRISKGDINYYYYGNQLIEEFDGESSTSYVVGNIIDKVFKMTKEDNNYFYHTNHIGSTLTITDENGKVIERMEYDPFGDPLFFDINGTEIPQSQIGNTILFAGREYDKESNNYYYRARYLNPTLGRFLQHDPLGFVDGYNDYTFVHNKPTKYIDVYGLAGININGGNGCNDFDICAQYPWLPFCKDYCKQHPEKCKGGKKPKEPDFDESIFDGWEGDPNWKPEDNSIFGNGFKNQLQDFNNDWADFYRDKLPDNDFFNNWFDGLSMINDANPYAAFGIEAATGFAAGAAAGAAVYYGGAALEAAAGAVVRAGSGVLQWLSTPTGRLVPIFIEY